MSRDLWTAVGLGLLAGHRSMMPLALVAGRLSRAPDHPASGPLRWLSDRRVARGLQWAAAGELAADKLPGIPSRTTPPSLVVRSGAGALAAAAVMGAAGRALLPGALAGAAAAMAATFASRKLRQFVSDRMPPFAAGALEDAAVVGAGRALARRL